MEAASTSGISITTGTVNQDVQLQNIASEKQPTDGKQPTDEKPPANKKLPPNKNQSANRKKSGNGNQNANGNQPANEAPKALIIDLGDGRAIDEVAHEIIHSQPKLNLTMWIFGGECRDDALSIGYSYQLMKNYSNVVLLDLRNIGFMPDLLLQSRKGGFPRSVVLIDGPTLDYIESVHFSNLLFDIISSIGSVICYKTSSFQRASILKQIHSRVSRTFTLVLKGSNDVVHRAEFQQVRQMSQRIQLGQEQLAFSENKNREDLLQASVMIQQTAENIQHHSEYYRTELQTMQQMIGHLQKSVKEIRNQVTGQSLERNTAAKTTQQVSTMNCEKPHAIAYMAKVKKRLEDQPEVYNQFLGILRTYQRQSISQQDLVVQVAMIFEDMPDMLEAFREFLPESVPQVDDSYARRT